MTAFIDCFNARLLRVNTLFPYSKVVSCLVTRGQLKQGNKNGPLVAGESIGCTRVLRNDRGVKVDTVAPGYTATIAGWKSMPPVGSTLLELRSDVSLYYFHEIGPVVSVF